VLAQIEVAQPAQLERGQYLRGSTQRTSGGWQASWPIPAL
jgi:hypothetical protein